ncbi:hypothetical protein GE21DRAFT_1291322 [Neurospora crassa]|nr:hypothetical protein GE21DRAFT_1291322 [Neurospora crassa]
MPGLSDFEATTSRSSCLLYLERGLEAERDSDPSDAPPHAGKLDQHPRLLGLENGRRDDASCVSGWVAHNHERLFPKMIMQQQPWLEKTGVMRANGPFSRRSCVASGLQY